MSDSAYQALLSQSPAFQGMDRDDQQRISSASATERERYIKIFEEEKQMLEEANKSFLKKNDEIIMGFKVTVKKDKQTRLKQAEEKAEAADEGIAEKLLKQI
jgi:hypothetical protein